MRVLLIAIFGILPLWSQDKKASGDGLADLAEMVLGKNGGNKLFYFPTEHSPRSPEEFGLRFEDVFFDSEDGTKLHGWFMKPEAEKASKGTVVFSHGNAGAVGYHIGFLDWFVKAGYQVLLYDYRGYGKSKGVIKREGLLKDVRGALKYVAGRKDVDASKLISFGHSLGGAKSLAALGEKKVPGVKAVISYAGFASYRDMAKWVAGDTGARLVTDELAARDLVAKIAPVPVLIIHGTRDGTVPLQQGELLFQKAKEPKTFFKIDGGGHNSALAFNNGEYQKKVLKWLDQVME